MHTINIDEIDEGKSQSFEIWVAGHRRITISVNKHNTSLQIPGGVDPKSVNFGTGSFFLRTRNFD